MTDDIEEAKAGLLAKRDELLGEVKALRAKVRALEGERDAAIERADAAETEQKRLLLDQPVEAVLSEMFVVPLRLVRAEIEDNFRFELDGDGKVQFRTKEGEPVKLEAQNREAEFSAADVRAAVAQLGTLDSVLRSTGASGGGAPGGIADGRRVNAEQNQPERVAQQFGLR